MYYFYILYSTQLDNYYQGHTSDLEDRIRKHNTNHKGYTGKSNDWELVYREAYSDKNEACQRERQIKKWKNRTRIESLIAKGQTSDYINPLIIESFRASPASKPIIRKFHILQLRF